MILKVGDDYIYGLDVTIEKQNKKIGTSSLIVGDYSYSFETSNTTEISRIFNLNESSSLYSEYEASLLTDGGIEVYKGYVTLDYREDVVEFSFFSGNTVWTSQISGSILDLDLSEYFVDQSVSGITGTFTNTEGIIYPLIDKGALSTRGYPVLIYDVDLALTESNQKNDFKPFFFVKTIINKIFNEIGIKLEGSLFIEPLYNKLVTTAHNLDAKSDEIDKRTVKARNNTTQGITTSYTQIDFDDITTFGYGDGSVGNYSTLTYTADIDMYVNIIVHIVLSTSKTIQVQAWRNGADAGHRVGTGNVVDIDMVNITSSKRAFQLNAGETMQVRILCTSGTANILPGSWLSIVPTNFTIIFAKEILSNIAKMDFVSDIFNIFNVVPIYNGYSKTLTCNLFNGIKQNEPVDLTSYLQSYEVITSEFLGDFGKKNNFTYEQFDSESINNYNNKIPTSWGNGYLESVINGDDIDIIELNFTAPYSYNNTIFSNALLLTDYVTVTVGDLYTKSITSVTDDGSGNAVFNIDSGTISISSGTIVRLENFSNPAYNGDFVVSSSTSTSFELHGVLYLGTSSGDFDVILYDEDNNDSQIICSFYNSTKQITISEDTGASNSVTTSSSYPVAMFHLFTSNEVHLEKQSLAWNLPSGDFNYQRSLMDSYYSDLKKILLNPFKISCQMILPETLFLNLKGSTPVRVITNRFNYIFTVDIITDYQNSYTPCTVELIKLP